MTALRKDERKRVSQKQEKDAAKRHGGRLQAGSGSGPYQKGDVRSDTEMHEMKTVLHGKKQITVKASDLRELERDALIEGRRPVFGIRVDGRDYVILDANDYEEMRQTLG